MAEHRTRTMENRKPVGIALRRSGNDVILIFEHTSGDDADEMFHALAESIKNHTPFTLFTASPH
jgi:hypothetical protein